MKFLSAKLKDIKEFSWVYKINEALYNFAINTLIFIENNRYLKVIKWFF